MLNDKQLTRPHHPDPTRMDDSNNPIQIRAATEHDIVPITDIYNHYVRTTHISLEEQPSTPASYLAAFQTLHAGGWPFLVAVADSPASPDSSTTVCGFAYAGAFNARSGYRFSAEDSVYLHPSYCGRGLGTRLLVTLCDRLRRGGKTRHILAKMSILPGEAADALPSCRLHAALGFSVVGRLPEVGYKLGRWVDVMIMQLTLDAALGELGAEEAEE